MKPGKRQAAGTGKPGGYSDWFLPSKAELNLVYTNLDKERIGGYYRDEALWSSSEYDDYNALIQRISDGSRNYATKYHTYLARAVRAF